MPYTPTTWVDGVTPVNATNLNKMETGIDTADADIVALDARVDTLEPEVAGKPSLGIVVALGG